MKIPIFLYLVFSISNCQASWFRELPKTTFEFSAQIRGTWAKKTKPRSAINSAWHKNIWSEKIHFLNGKKFTKTYKSEDFSGNLLTQTEISGEGAFEINGNWILLNTRYIYINEKIHGKSEQNQSKSVDSSLLYYYYQDENLIIPMIYDMGYKEQEFGVKDGISMPYEENSNFFRYIKIYAFKEFQSHAYYPEN